MDFLSLFFVILLVAILLYAVFFVGGHGINPKDRKFFQEKWWEIQHQKDLRHAIMDADKILSEALRRKGYQGTLGQQLQKAKSCFSHLDNVWYAHKLRNRLAHELDFVVTDTEGRKALAAIGRALLDLKIL